MFSLQQECLWRAYDDQLRPLSIALAFGLSQSTIGISTALNAQMDVSQPCRSCYGKDACTHAWRTFGSRSLVSAVFLVTSLFVVVIV